MGQKQGISFFVRFIALFMSLYIFNFSIDSRDSQPDSVAEDLSFNDIESVYEFVMEHILGFEDAVAEHDEPDQEDGGSFDFNKVFVDTSFSFVHLHYNTKNVKIATGYVKHFFPLFIEIDSPPPKA